MLYPVSIFSFDHRKQGEHCCIPGGILQSEPSPGSVSTRVLFPFLSLSLSAPVPHHVYTVKHDRPRPYACTLHTLSSCSYSCCANSVYQLYFDFGAFYNQPTSFYLFIFFIANDSLYPAGVTEWEAILFIVFLIISHYF